MSKSTKSEVLKHWFGIDQVLFGRSATSHLSEDNLLQYLTTKGALLSNLFEIYEKLGYSKEKNYQTVKEMKQHAIQEAKNCKVKAKKLLESESVLKMVKQEIKEMSVSESLSDEQVAKFVISKRRNAISLDSMMIESVLTTENKTLISDWQGKVLVDAHKTLRDSLIDIAME